MADSFPLPKARATVVAYRHSPRFASVTSVSDPHHFIAILKSRSPTYDLYIIMPSPKREAFSTEKEDRRRSPRVSCGGLARIISLPSEDGLSLSGKVRDLSLGGCGIETVFPLEGGTRAEILLHVNASSFRALARVRAVRVRYMIGVEFLHISATGQDTLAELIGELARQRAIASTLRAARREPDPEALCQNRATLLKGSAPIIGSVVSVEEAEANSVIADRCVTIIDQGLDLFI